MWVRHIGVEKLFVFSRTQIKTFFLNPRFLR
jgi:hypothetical protein